MRHAISTLVAVLLLLLARVAPPEARDAHGQEPSAQQVPPSPVASPQVFRANVNLVPVDVHVLDRNGNPVTDLLETDFTVHEDGALQQIQHFSWAALTAQKNSPVQQMLRADTEPTLGAQNHRVFLIVFGRGRLQDPGKGVDGAIHLIKNLLPQDYVGIHAWNRATDLTNDHKTVLKVAERFRHGHERIEALMEQQFSGLAAIYGGSRIGADVQRDIDAVFAGPEAANMRTLPAKRVGAVDAISQSTDRVAEALMTEATRAGAGSALNVSLGEYVKTNAQSAQDVTNIAAGVEYLRYVPGEKHLVFVSETGVLLPSVEGDRDLAAKAADARVALSVLHTGGTTATAMPPPLIDEVDMPPGGVRSQEAEVARLLAWSRQWQSSTSKRVSALTGGQFTSLQSGKAFFDGIDRASRFGYVLGYYSTRPIADGTYRNITVRVNRPGLRVNYRHGYFARRRPASFDRVRNVTYSRVSTAAGYGMDVRDIALTATATTTIAAAGGQPGQIAIEVKIAPERLGFVEIDGRRKGAVEVAVFCGDGSSLVGQSWNTVALEMTDEAYQRFMTNGLRYTGTLAISAPARFVKVVVYDARADLIGSVIVPVK